MAHQTLFKDEIKKIFKFFFQEKMFINKLMVHFRKFYKSISLINRKMRDKLDTKHEKLHILTIHWDRVSLQLQKDMMKNRDAEIE